MNKFGSLNGFQILLERFTAGGSLSVPVIAALIRPFGFCYEVLTPHTVQKYFMPIVVSYCTYSILLSRVFIFLSLTCVLDSIVNIIYIYNKKCRSRTLLVATW